MIYILMLCQEDFELCV